MYDSGNPKPVRCDGLEGWSGEGGGGAVQEGGDACMPMADSCSCRAEAITVLHHNHPSIKINKKKKTV